MATVLVLFLDGVGLGTDDPQRNPLCAAPMPNLRKLLDGHTLVGRLGNLETRWATLLPIDARLGVKGAPQSASGQAALLTGMNVPAVIGGHFGPKPNQAIRNILQQDNLFSAVMRAGGRVALLNAYPPQYFDAVRRGRRLHAAIPLAAVCAGIPLRTAKDLQAGRAISADFTGEGWAARADFPPAPVYTPPDAGRLLARLAAQVDLAWFDFWPSDLAAHHNSMDEALAVLERFDAVLGGLVDAWDKHNHLVLITSDHGNLEDLEQHGHTLNPVPALLIGPLALRRAFTQGLESLTDIAPAIQRAISSAPDTQLDAPRVRGVS